MILRRIFECPSGFYAMADDLTIEWWRAPGRAPELRELNRAFRDELGLRKGRKFCTLAVMAMPAGTMLTVSEEERRLITDRILEQGPFLHSSITVIAMSGFSGAVVRGILGALFQVRRKRTPSKVAGSVRDAMPMLRSNLAELAQCAVTEGELRLAVEAAIPPSWTDVPPF